MVKVIRPDEESLGGGVSPSEFEQMLKGNLTPEMVQPGEMVSGTVVSVGREWVFVDIGGKSEGMIAADEFIDGEEEELSVKVGDRVEATVLTLRGGIRLSRSLRKSSQSDDVLGDAFDNRIPVEGRVTELRKGGFGIAIGAGHQAFCPISQIDNRYVEKGEEYVGQSFMFRIIELGEEMRNIVVSRRVLLDEEKQAQGRALRERIKPGMVFDGEVRKVMPYGAFVNIGGMDGLVHVSELAWDRVEKPEEHVTEGQKVKVKVLGFDTATDKLSLSIREAGADPWDDIEQRFPTGAPVAGTVTRVEPYGAFVRIATGIEGLVHISDMSWGGRHRHAGELCQVGDQVEVTVLGIERERKRISLGMKQVHADPFEGALGKYRVGTMATGTVQRIGASGVFVELEEGVVAFLPGSLAGTQRGETLSSHYKVGSSVQLTVREIDGERRRITLEAVSSESQEERTEFESYMKNQGIQKMGSFGELLQKALKKK